MSLSDFYTQTAIANAPKHTGRLPLSGDEERSTLPPYTLTAQEPYVVPSRVAEKMQYRHESTPLNSVFFSEDNIENLQSNECNKDSSFGWKVRGVQGVMHGLR